MYVYMSAGWRHKIIFAAQQISQLHIAGTWAFISNSFMATRMHKTYLLTYKCDCLNMYERIADIC